jgi:hypothetical protein
LSKTPSAKASVRADTQLPLPIPKVSVAARPTVERGSLLEGLTPSQKQAVTHAGGPLLIVAGRGPANQDHTGWRSS